MAPFKVTKVPIAGIDAAGTSLLIRLSDETGNELDLVAPWTAFEEILNAFNEAASKAHDRRREHGLVDKSSPRGDTELQECLGFRFLVADDRSHMTLQLQTPTGRIDISFPASMSQGFREATIRNSELLAAPPRKSGH